MTQDAERSEKLGAEYLKALFDFWPNQGSWAGLHEYDDRQPELSAPRIEDRLRELARFERELAGLSAQQLDAAQAFDLGLLRTAVAGERFQWEEERQYRRNPDWYLRALDISHYLTRSYAPLEERLRAAIGYLQHAPAVLAAARANLGAQLPRPMVETALDTFQGMSSFYAEDLARWAAPLQNEALKQELELASRTARAALDEFRSELQDRYLPAAADDFALGPESYRRMLLTEEVDLPLETVLQVGEDDLKRNLEGAREKARQVDPNRSLQEVFALLRQDHPTAAELLPSTSALLEEIRQFVLERDVVSVPSQVRAQVTETPAFMRWAFAAMDTPGPFEQVATEAYYYVTPPDARWSPAQQDEWLSSFNRYVLRDVSIHEAYPGHYVHFLHLNHRVRRPLRQALASYAFIEGWAHYVEEMMLDIGYGDHNPRLRLAQLEEALARDCRYVCSVRMHTQGMSVDEATRFFMENAFMEETPARKEAVRGTFDPGYLYYTLGKLMILKLREDVKIREGTNFNLKEFHDALLGFGAPPLPLARRAMLGADSGSDL